MTTHAKVWRAADGGMFHNDCFEEEETLKWREQNGYKPVAVADLEEDDQCESCGGKFLAGLKPIEDDTDDTDDDEDEPDEE